MANLLGIDVGTVRIGLATADSGVPIAVPLVTIAADGTEIEKIAKVIEDKAIETVVVGYPRNQSGDATEQTNISESLAEKLRPYATVVYQDESLTSVMAEERLKSAGKPYEKADIDAMASALILQDYLEEHHAA